MSFAYRCYPLPEWGLLLREAVGALIFQAQREMAFVRKQEQTPGNAPTASLLDLSSSSIVLEEDMLSALLLMQDSGSAEMSYLRQMQNSFAGELSLQQALRDLTNVVPGSLNLDWRLQLLPGYHLREPGQIFRSSMTI